MRMTMSKPMELDKLVGRIAGAIYNHTFLHFPFPPMVLIPGLTFKVRKILERVAKPEFLSAPQKMALAKEIRISLIPLLFSFDIIGEEKIKELEPAIESAALHALADHRGPGLLTSPTTNFPFR